MSAEREIERLRAVLPSLHDRLQIPISVDTQKPEVARAALDLGADMVNDVSGLRDPNMRQVIARAGAPVVVVHMRGTPTTMQSNLVYADLRAEVYGFLARAVADAVRDGIAARSAARRSGARVREVRSAELRPTAPPLRVPKPGLPGRRGRFPQVVPQPDSGRYPGERPSGGECSPQPWSPRSEERPSCGPTTWPDRPGRGRRGRGPEWPVPRPSLGPRAPAGMGSSSSRIRGPT